MKYKILLFFVALIFNLFIEVLAQNIEEKVTKLMPPYTELLWKKQDTSQFINSIQYKFSTLSQKEKIIEFYRLMFTNEGFSQIESYSVSKRSSVPEMVYFFTKPNKLIVLNILRMPENDLNIYYITFYTPNIEGIKDFDIKLE
ncbi:MAG: hypothetical protein NC918_06015 [Candidatus Omnitrophica bacterium]|nr:hypothetical protein [Candidatus Omnitrophota bacterium]